MMKCPFATASRDNYEQLCNGRSTNYKLDFKFKWNVSALCIFYIQQHYIMKKNLPLDYLYAFRISSAR